LDIQEALKMADAFHRYLNCGDKSLIERYTKEELRAALNVVPHSDSRHQWYKEMERRIEEIERKERERAVKKEKRKEKWIDKIITYILGILTGLTIAYFKEWLKLK
jgi:uncharacterized alpha-E superfamily protein